MWNKGHGMKHKDMERGTSDTVLSVRHEGHGTRDMD